MARLLRSALATASIVNAGATMHWVRITRPKYEQSQRHAGRIGEVVGYWGPENSASGRDGYLVEFEDGEIVGVTHDEVEIVDGPEEVERASFGGADRDGSAGAGSQGEA